LTSAVDNSLPPKIRKIPENIPLIALMKDLRVTILFTPFL
jgi:hypothetical protein